MLRHILEGELYMKSSQNFFRRLLCVPAAFLIFFASSVTAFADVWIPPTDKYYNEDVYNILNSAEGRRSMNLFLSNFSEANLESYNPSGTSDADVLKILLKHFELNAPLYSGVTVTSDGSSGIIMTITQSTVEKAAKNMFNRQLTKHPAGGFAGYRDGKYICTANQAGSQLKVLSIANYIEYFGDNKYEAFFTVYKVESNIDKYYSNTASEIEKVSGVKKIGEGSAPFNYVGGTGSSAFRLAGYSLSEIDKSQLIYTQPNEPVVQSVTTQAPQTSTPTSETSTEQTLPVTQSDTTKQETTIGDKAVIDDEKDKADLRKLAIITVLVVLTAAGATGVILLAYQKKKK